jgi:photosystem II stability/assembly factor-like uncharacterized protein
MTNQTWHKVDSPAVIFSMACLGKEGWLLGTDEGLWCYRNSTCEIINEALRAAAITAVAAAPAYPRHSLMLVGSVDGIARSIDGGKTWTSATLSQTAQVSQLLLSPDFESDGIAFAATLENGVLRTTDEGLRWHSWNFGLLDLETLALAISPTFAEDELVYVATGTGVFRSINGGRAWREMAFAGEGPEAEAALPPTGIAMTRDVLVVSSESEGLYYSTDRGDSWFRRDTFNTGETNTLTTSQDGTKLLLATPDEIAISADAGVTWQHVPESPNNIIAIGLADDGTLLCGTQDDGLWVWR